MNRFALIALSLFGMNSACSKQPTTPVSKFRAGQVWAFTPPAHQPHARLTVLRVEDHEKLGTIVHIAISGVSYGNGHTELSHLPFAEHALEQSVTSLERESGPVPDYAEGYTHWREAFDAGEGGVFTVSVAEAFDVVVQAMKSSETGRP